MDEQDRFKVIVTDHAWPYNDLKKDATDEENSKVGFIKYDKMSIEAMFDMKPRILDVAAKDCLVFAWGTWPFLIECINVHQHWGFSYVTGAYVWTKTNRLPALTKILQLYKEWQNNSIKIPSLEQLTNRKPYFGMGRWTASNTEYVLLFKRGKPAFRNKLLSQFIATADGAYNIQPVQSMLDSLTLVHPVMGHSRKPEEVQDRIEQISEGPYLELFATRKRPNWVCLGNAIDGMDINESLKRLAILGKDVYNRNQDGRLNYL